MVEFEEIRTNEEIIDAVEDVAKTCSGNKILIKAGYIGIGALVGVIAYKCGKKLGTVLFNKFKGQEEDEIVVLNEDEFEVSEDEETEEK